MAEKMCTKLTAYLVSHGLRTKTQSEDRKVRPVKYGPYDLNVLYQVLEALWLYIVKPVLDALKYSVSYSSFKCSSLLTENLADIGSTTYLMVDNWSSGISPSPCGRYI